MSTLDVMRTIKKAVEDTLSEKNIKIAWEMSGVVPFTKSLLDHPMVIRNTELAKRARRQQLQLAAPATVAPGGVAAAAPAADEAAAASSSSDSEEDSDDDDQGRATPDAMKRAKRYLEQQRDPDHPVRRPSASTVWVLEQTDPVLLDRRELDEQAREALAAKKRDKAAALQNSRHFRSVQRVTATPFIMRVLLDKQAGAFGKLKVADLQALCAGVFAVTKKMPKKKAELIALLQDLKATDTAKWTHAVARKATRSPDPPAETSMDTGSDQMQGPAADAAAAPTATSAATTAMEVVPAPPVPITPSVMVARAAAPTASIPRATIMTQHAPGNPPTARTGVAGAGMAGGFARAPRPVTHTLAAPAPMQHVATPALPPVLATTATATTGQRSAFRAMVTQVGPARSAAPARILPPASVAAAALPIVSAPLPVALSAPLPVALSASTRMLTPVRLSTPAPVRMAAVLSAAPAPARPGPQISTPARAPPQPLRMPTSTSPRAPALVLAPAAATTLAPATGASPAPAPLATAATLSVAARGATGITSPLPRFTLSPVASAALSPVAPLFAMPRLRFPVA
jgi:hypothetical protein